MKQNVFGMLVASVVASISLSQVSLAQKTSTIGVPDGYFVYNSTLFARSGGSVCGFLNQGHAEIYRRVYPAPNVKVTNFSSYRNFGACAIPAAYFDLKGTVFYSFGDGNVCGFLTSDAYEDYRNYYRAYNIGKLSTFPPKEVANNIGKCPPPLT